MILNIFLLTIMIICAVWAVMARSLLKAAIGLALVSAIITILMYNMNAPLAGVFELSVCTGLITVIFLSTIGLTKPRSHQELLAATAARNKRYIYIIFVIILFGLISVLLYNLPVDIKTSTKVYYTDVRSVLWNFRQLDLFGQIIVLLAGAFGVIILFKEKK